MSVAYVDSSVLVAIAFGEPGVAGAVRRMKACSVLVSAPLLEAEFLSALRREGRPLDEGWLSPLTWIHPDRSLRPEIDQVLEAGQVRGADCWHLATALWVAPEPAELTFLTLDRRQREVATTLGFAR
jgi:predicted nucleic acid-binding protein